MSSSSAVAYEWVDEAALATGLGLVLLGLVGLGLVETLLGSAHVADLGIRVGDLVIGLPPLPQLRASIIATGFTVLLVWALSRVGRAMLGSVTSPR